MQLNGNAKLTIKQRVEVRRLQKEEGRSIRSLAEEFRVTKKTIQKWIHQESPLDQVFPASRRRSVVDATYRQAIVNHRKKYPNHGPVRITQELSSEYPQARPSHIRRVLLQENLIEKKLLNSGRGLP